MGSGESRLCGRLEYAARNACQCVEISSGRGPCAHVPPCPGCEDAGGEKWIVQENVLRSPHEVSISPNKIHLAHITEAVKDGDLDKLKKLLPPTQKAGHLLRDPESGKLLIVFAIILGHLHILKYLTRNHPRAVTDSINSLHLAASAGQCVMCIYLLDEMLAFDRTFNPRTCFNDINENPIDISSKKEVRLVLQLFSDMCYDGLYAPGAANALQRPPMMYAKDFCLLTTLLPFIGDKNELAMSSFAEVDFSDIEQAMLGSEGEWLEHNAKGPAVRWIQSRNILTNSCEKPFQWRCHPTAVHIIEAWRDAWKQPVDSLFMQGLLRQITKESFLPFLIDDMLECHNVGPTPREKKAQPAIVPVAQILCRAIAMATLDHPWNGEVYFAHRLHPEVLSCFQAPGKNPMRRVLAWDRLLFGHSDVKVALRAAVRSHANCFFIITPGEKCDLLGSRAADLRRVSFYPQEALVLYPLAQHFVWQKAYRLSLRLLYKKVGCKPDISGDSLNMEMHVIEMEACDLFWELCGDLFKTALWITSEEADNIMIQKWERDLSLVGEDKLCSRIVKAAEVSEHEHATNLYRLALQHTNDPARSKTIEWRLSRLNAMKFKIPTLRLAEEGLTRKDKGMKKEVSINAPPQAPQDQPPPHIETLATISSWVKNPK